MEPALPESDPDNSKPGKESEEKSLSGIHSIEAYIGALHLWADRHYLAVYINCIPHFCYRLGVIGRGIGWGLSLSLSLGLSPPGL
jgi:hypothetical protein